MSFEWVTVASIKPFATRAARERRGEGSYCLLARSDFRGARYFRLQKWWNKAADALHCSWLVIILYALYHVGSTRSREISERGDENEYVQTRRTGALSLEKMRRGWQETMRDVVKKRKQESTKTNESKCWIKCIKGRKRFTWRRNANLLSRWEKERIIFYWVGLWQPIYTINLIVNSKQFYRTYCI